jgi:hypothetical protein
MKRFSMLLTALAGVNAFGADPGAPTTGHSVGEVVDVCNAWRLPRSLIGHVVSVRGFLLQDIEFAVLWDPQCRREEVTIEYTRDGPTILGCVARPDNPKCGGVKTEHQRATVTGVLTSTDQRHENSHGFVPTVTKIQAQQFRSVTKKSRHGI